MITEQARVVNVSDSGRLELEVQRQTACGNCEVQGACGVGALGRLLGIRKARLSLPGDDSFKKGDVVTIGIPEGALVKTSLMIYLLPLLCLLVSAVLCEAILGLPEGINIILSLSLAGLVWYLVASRATAIQVELLLPQAKQQSRNTKDFLLS